MGKPFCIAVVTDGLKQAFWASKTDDQNAWIEALRKACTPPEQPAPPAATPSSSENKSNISIELGGQQQQGKRFLIPLV